MVSLRIRSFAGLAAASAGAMLATSLGNTASAAEERDASRVIEEIVEPAPRRNRLCRPVGRHIFQLRC